MHLIWYQYLLDWTSVNIAGRIHDGPITHIILGVQGTRFFFLFFFYITLELISYNVDHPYIGSLKCPCHISSDFFELVAVVLRYIIVATRHNLGKIKFSPFFSHTFLLHFPNRLECQIAKLFCRFISLHQRISSIALENHFHRITVSYQHFHWLLILLVYSTSLMLEGMELSQQFLCISRNFVPRNFVPRN